MIFDKNYQQTLYFIQHRYKNNWFDINHDFDWNIDYKQYPKYDPNDIRKILEPFKSFSHNVGLCSMRGSDNIFSAMHLMHIIKEYNPTINFRVIRRIIKVDNHIIGKTKEI